MLALITLGVCLVVLILAGLVGEATYHWVLVPALHKYAASKNYKEEVVELGEQIVSEGVELVMEKMGSTPVMKCVERHRVGDWGEVDDESRGLNALSLRGDERCGFESFYTMEDGVMLRIITYEDCSATLLLTEEEYYQEEKLYVRSLKEYSTEQAVELRRRWCKPQIFGRYSEKQKS